MDLLTHITLELIFCCILPLLTGKVSLALLTTVDSYFSYQINIYCYEAPRTR
jgi:hypothetical protein